MGKSIGLTFTFGRDVADSSSATLSAKRPDVTGYLQNALVLRGEEKDGNHELPSAVSDLISKASRYNHCAMGCDQHLLAITLKALTIACRAAPQCLEPAVVWHGPVQHLLRCRWLPTAVVCVGARQGAHAPALHTH